MFTRMDKNKDWLMSCNECKQLFRTLQVPITDDEVEELVVSLDRNNDGYLDYRELLKGRLAYKVERQQEKRKVDEISPLVQPPQFLSVSGSGSNTDDANTTNSVTSADDQQKGEKMKSKQKQHLMEAMRSPELTRSIRTKQHIAPSTLHESIAQQVDHYRQEELKQFQNLLLYCRIHGIVLNQSLLERGEYLLLIQ